jgi:hypothetical protein
MSRLLAILLIAGLVTAPFTIPAAANSAESAAMEMASMSDDMPCCPSKAPAPVDCDKCVLMAVCMSSSYAGVSVAIVHPFLITSSAIALRLNDSLPEGLGHSPPEHPPRTLV